jgi:hypothetical protein
MPFEVPKNRNKMLSTLFPQGYDNQKNKYHNIGTLSTPYANKPRSSMGDYGPPQNTVYYTDYNRNYPYDLDNSSAIYNSNDGSGCNPGQPQGYNSNYPDKFITSNYFAPRIYKPTGHVNSINKRESFSFENDYNIIDSSYPKTTVKNDRIRFSKKRYN